MMERGIDMAVREVRLNTGARLSPVAVQNNDLHNAATNECDQPACGTPPGVAPLGRIPTIHPRRASCKPPEPFQPARNLKAVFPMMIVRVCGKIHPLLPWVVWGGCLSRMDNGYYRLVSTQPPS
jgi:hypothetical protein